MTEYMKRFSHIYVEEGAKDYDRTKRILSLFPDSEIIEIRDYRDVFNRRNQNPEVQHLSQKLILAVKKDGFLYEGSPVCQSFGEERFYYTSNVMNCVYDCEYCFLKGMYPTTNIVIFVNLEDTFREIDKIIEVEKLTDESTGAKEIIGTDESTGAKEVIGTDESSGAEEVIGTDESTGAGASIREGKKSGSNRIYISISYESDLMALDKITGMLKDWSDYVRNKNNVLLEVRTKCSNIDYNIFSFLPNMILAMTMSPDEVISKYEKYTPNLAARCEAVEKAIEKKIPVRLCFDPMLYVRDYKNAYSNMVDIIFSKIDAGKLRDISLGSFRISKEYIKNFRKGYPKSEVVHFPYELRDGFYQYPEEMRLEMEDFLYKKLTEYCPEEKIFCWT